MQTIIKPVEEYIWKGEERQKNFDDHGHEEKIQVSSLFTRASLFYEKARNMVDNVAQNLLRKTTIERILKRKLVFELKKTVKAEKLIDELIRAQYLPNNSLPVSKIHETQKIIDRYVIFMQAVSARKRGKDRQKLVDWILSIMACDLEINLSPQPENDNLVELMYRVVAPKLKFQNFELNDEERYLQVYIAMNRALLKSDNAIIRYHLFKFFLTDWNNFSVEQTQKLAREIDEFQKKVEDQVTHRLGMPILNLMRRYAIYFLILQKIIKCEGHKIIDVLSNPELFQAKVQEVCEEKYKSLKVILRTSAIHSVIYIFITKMMMVLVVEIPFDIFVTHHFNFAPLGINAIFHPFLMFLIITSIKIPGEKNTKKIIQGLRWIVYNEEQELEPQLIIRKPKKRGLLHHSVYFLTGAISLGLIFWVLYKLNFNILSMIFFVFFLSAVSFFGVRVRQSARELIVVHQKDRFANFVLDLFAIPILKMGQWFAGRFKNINLFLFIFDFILEAPFKLVIETLERWMAFLKEKKEEIY